MTHGRGRNEEQLDPPAPIREGSEMLAEFVSQVPTEIRISTEPWHGLKSFLDEQLYAGSNYDQLWSALRDRGVAIATPTPGSE